MMNTSVAQGSIQEYPADTLIVNLFEGVTAPSGATGAVDGALNGAISELIQNGDFSGKRGESVVLYPRGAIPAKRVIVVGLGESGEFDLEGVRSASATAIRQARKRKANHVATIVHGAGIAGLPAAAAAQATVEGSLLAAYRFDADKEQQEQHIIETFTVVEFSTDKIEAFEAGIAAARAIGAGVQLARDLVNMPPNVATPTRMAQAAEEIAEEQGMELTVGDREWAAKRDMGAFLAVAKGAGEPPKFIVLEHNSHRQDVDTIVLIGKGITFDTGGISIKPSERMGLMKSDMAGAAAVLGAMKSVGLLDLPLRVIGITPCTENMPDAEAYRPADVIKASNGKTIEIISTDAEGRMVLADGLVYAAHYKPKAVVDLATLTGASVVALGKGMAAGLFANDDALRDQLLYAAKSTHERLWPLPLWDDYKKAIKSDVADMKNSGGRMGGVATSAIFLKQFTDYPWAHLDIASVAFGEKDSGYNTAGATGFGVRLLLEFLRNW
ncbi:MAG: leucyl aminopeptidase [Chloroflexota bacterium]|nr:MAG: leucyl aminopeptidase [Chloroflexota bacterium]